MIKCGAFNYLVRELLFSSRVCRTSIRDSVNDSVCFELSFADIVCLNKAAICLMEVAKDQTLFVTRSALKRKHFSFPKIFCSACF